MYARYNYSAAATLVNIINDMVAILTGTTDKATLSAGCDQTNTFILNTYSNAGWTLHDLTGTTVGTSTITNASPAVINKGTTSSLSADLPVSFTTTGALPTGLTVDTIYYVVAGLAAGTCSVSATPGGAAINTSSAGSGTHTIYSASAVILKAAVVDDATAFKYVGLDTYTAGEVILRAHESWNATTHTGTNSTTIITSGQRTSVGTAASILISAKQSHIALQSNVAAGIGAVTTLDWTAAFERTRLSPWDTVANAYPPVVNTRGSINSFVVTTIAYAPRYKNPAGGDLGTTSATVYCAAIGACGGVRGGAYNTFHAMYQKIPDGLGGFYTPLNEFYYRNALNSFMGGSVSAVCDVWLTVAYPNNLDEVFANGKTYILWQNTGVPANTGFTAFPKG